MQNDSCKHVFNVKKIHKLRREIVTSDGQTGITGLVSSCFQVTPDLAAIVVNLRKTGQSVCDFELGNDIYLFDSMENMGAREPVTILRSFEDKHPEYGTKIYWSRYDGHVGFVPVDAKLPDGTPHPAAGTGFSIGTVIAIPQKLAGAKEFSVYRNNSGYFLMITQLAYRDGTLQCTGRTVVRGVDYFPGGCAPGLGDVLFDGEDIIIPFSTVGKNGGSYGQGLLRMEFSGDKWQPGGFIMVEPEKGDTQPMFNVPAPSDGLSGCEGSVVRLAGNEVAYTCREWGNTPWAPEPLEASRVRIWRGTLENGLKKVYEKPFFHTLSPISVGVTHDGVPFLMTNAYQTVDWRGETVGSISLREKLVLYPLNGENLEPGEPLMLCDTMAEFGEPEKTARWYADHPMSWRITLKGCKINLATWRVFNHIEATGRTPTEHSAAYVAEIECLV